MRLFTRLIFSALLAVMSVAMVVAEGRLSSSTQAFIHKMNGEQTAAKRLCGERDVKSSQMRKSLRSRHRSGVGADRVPVQMVDGKQTVQAFVSVDGWDVAPIAEIEALGVQVNGEFGDVLTVTAPVDKLEAIAKLGKVRQVAVARRVHLCTDKQRSTANVDLVHAGTGLDMPYTGRDVVVGVIDAGIDFNHMAFKDADGNTRVKRVYMPGGTGNSPVVNGKTLPGAEFVTPEEISKLTSDLLKESHGTHTSAIAVGTKVGAYGGMAPEADIVLCGLANDLSDANVVNSINYIFSYAESVGKPAVINMSFGDHVGPHDGTSEFCKSLDSLCGKGRLMVLAAGNEGEYSVHFSCDFEGSTTSQSSQKAVLLIDADWQGGYYEAAFDIYGRDKRTFSFQYVVVDATGKQLCVSPVQSLSASGTEFDMSKDSDFKNYYDGYGIAYGVVDANSGKYNIYLEIDAETTSDNDEDWYIGLLFWGVSGQQIDGWDIDGYTDFTNLGYSNFINGDSEMSISGMATGKNTISVGAFVSRNTYPAVDGNDYTYSSLRNGAIASFSSYGPDANGVQRPEIVGGGATVVSAVSSYDTSTTISDYNYLAAEVTDASGKKHYWGDMMGTSMSSPQVAGILALWLQVNPNLTVDDVRDVFEKTAICDSYVTSGPAKKWGYGKIDALAGIKQVILASTKEVNVDDANVVVYPNPSNGDFEVFAPGEENVEICLYSVCGTLVRRLFVSTDGGSASVSLAGQLSSGVYVVTVSGDMVRKSSLLIIE
ncbi:MAG: S8 family serine peptidase [Muribaculaceae bacterium]